MKGDLIMDIMKIGEKNPNYLGSFDLYDMPKTELTVTIKKIVDEEIVSERGKERTAVCYFAENYKPMILNSTNKKRLAKLFRSTDTDAMVGKRITIGVEEVKAFGDIHDALRIKKKLPTQNIPKVQEEVFFCEQCGGKILPFANKDSKYMAGYTKEKYGKALCSKCATEAKQQIEKELKQLEPAAMTETEDVTDENNENLN